MSSLSGACRLSSVKPITNAPSIAATWASVCSPLRVLLTSMMSPTGNPVGRRTRKAMPVPPPSLGVAVSHATAMAPSERRATAWAPTALANVPTTASTPTTPPVLLTRRRRMGWLSPPTVLARYTTA